jgi:hypothetical protein
MVKSALNEIGIEGCAERDGLREAGAVGRSVAVEAFFVKHDGDAEAAVFEEELLDGVGELGHGASFFAAACVAGTADLAESAAIAEGFFAFARSKSPFRRRVSGLSPARRRASARPSLRGSCGRGDL